LADKQEVHIKLVRKWQTQQLQPLLGNTTKYILFPLSWHLQIQ